MWPFRNKKQTPERTFLIVAHRCLQSLADRGFTFSEMTSGHSVCLDCQRGKLEIRVCYEIFAAPWCDLYEAGYYVRRIAVDAEFPSSAPLAGTPAPYLYSESLLQTHAHEIEVWCKRLLRILEDEKIAA
jgi:hypothetical protein